MPTAQTAACSSGCRGTPGVQERSVMRRLVIIGLVAAVAGGLAAGASARPQNPHGHVAAHKRNGRIAFQALVGRFPQVFTVEPDGTGLRQVTHVPSKDPGAENPIW